MTEYQDEPRPGAQDPTADPRPWWFREFLRDFRDFKREAFRRMDTLERDLDERVGAGRAQRNQRTGVKDAAVLIVAASGVLASILVAAFFR